MLHGKFDLNNQKYDKSATRIMTLIDKGMWNDAWLDLIEPDEWQDLSLAAWLDNLTLDNSSVDGLSDNWLDDLFAGLDKRDASDVFSWPKKKITRKDMDNYFLNLRKTARLTDYIHMITKMSAPSIHRHAPFIIVPQGHHEFYINKSDLKSIKIMVINLGYLHPDRQFRLARIDGSTFLIVSN